MENNNIAKVTVIADSLNSETGDRLTTLECEYPRFIHAEIMTHRTFSRSAQSSRAIPVSTIIKKVQEDIWYPIFTKNKRGMSGGDEFTGRDLAISKHYWDQAKQQAIHTATNYVAIDCHKQTVNRILEPFSKITVLISSTEWINFFNLRLVKELVQPEMFILATEMKKAINESVPFNLGEYQWHLPYILEGEKEVHTLIELKKLSVARCARVSYLNHLGTRDVKKDYELHDDLLRNCHMSPFEMVAEATPRDESRGNYKGFVQYRQDIEMKIWDKYRTIPSGLILNREGREIDI